MERKKIKSGQKGKKCERGGEGAVEKARWKIRSGWKVKGEQKKGEGMKVV